jgi:hypothetical protein
MGLAAEPDPQGVEFFEKKIRPVLVERCYKCHSAQAQPAKGGLLLDSRAGWQTGGDSGPAIDPGKLDTRQLLPILKPGSGAAPLTRATALRRRPAQCSI